MSSKKPSKNPGLGFWIFIAFWAILVISAVIVDDVEAGYPDDRNLIDWGDNWQRPRGEVRLNLMGHWSDGVTSRLQGVCYDVMEEKNKPYYLYLGIQFGIFEPVVGYSFRDKEWVTGLRLYPEWENWHAYSNFEYQLETQSFYYLAQAELHVSPLIECGAEIEGWGDLDDKLISNGIGLNVIFNLQGYSRYGNQDSKLRVEAAVQFREIDDELKPQAIVRLIFTPKMDTHTPERRDRRGGRY